MTIPTGRADASRTPSAPIGTSGTSGTAAATDTTGTTETTGITGTTGTTATTDTADAGGALRRRTAIAIGAVAPFLGALDSTVVTLALPALRRDLGGGTAELSWVLDGYTLAFAAALLGAGALSDAKGARRTLTAGFVVFGLSSLAAGFAWTMPVLIAARLVQGVGAALLLPSSLSLATAAEPDPARRARVVGLWAAAGGVGMALGPIVGGVVVALAGWPWIFWAKALVAAAALAAALLATRPVPTAPRGADPAGQAAGALAIGALVLALIEAGRLGWSHPLVLGALAAVLAAAAAFAAIERRVAAPLLPARLSRSPGFAPTLLLGLLVNVVFYGVLFTASLLLQDGWDLPPLRAGLLLLPLTGLIAVANLTAARLVERFGERRTMAVAYTLVAAGLGAAAVAASADGPWPLALALLPAGAGTGALVPLLTSRLLARAPADTAGTASAVFNAARQVGSAIGVAVAGLFLSSAAGLAGGAQAAFGAAVAAIAVSAAVALLGPTRPR